MDEQQSILYIGGVLPTRSETFVYREVFALRDLGVEVMTASVHAPDRGLGDERLDELAEQAIPIYGAGVSRLIRDACAEVVSHPLRTLGTLSRAAIDACFGSDVKFDKRPKVLWQCMAALALARRVRRRGGGIAHIHAHMAHVPATIAMYCARQLGSPFSFTGHAVDLMRQRTLLRQKLERAAFVACISHWHRNFYQDVAGIAEDRLPIVRCGVNVDEFAPAGSDADSGPAVRILSVGRLVEKKGFDVLINAISRLNKDEGVGEIECRIVGDGPERDRLAGLIEEAGAQRKIELLGARDNSEVRALMGECDLFVLPCKIDPTGDQDGIPVVLMEAMARGLCTVSGDLPTIRELILQGENGWMVEPGDVESLASALVKLCSDPGLRRTLGKRARDHVVDEFSSDVNVRRLMDALSVDETGSGGEEDKECWKHHKKTAA